MLNEAVISTLITHLQYTQHTSQCRDFFLSLKHNITFNDDFKSTTKEQHC